MKKVLQSLSIMCAAVLICFMASACTQPENGPKNIPVTGVTLNVGEKTLLEEGTFTLIAAVEPADATNKEITWNSNNKNIATVNDSGEVTAVAAGTATITVTTADGGYTDTCFVTVRPLPLSITVTEAPTKIKIGSQLDLDDIVVTAAFADDTDEIIEIALDNISGFDSDTAGPQTVTVTYGGFSDTFEVTVLALSKIEVAIDSEFEHILVGLGETLDLDDIAVTATYKNEGDEFNVIVEEVTITLGNISGFNSNTLGKQTVTVTYGGKSDTFEVMVLGVSKIEITKQPDKTMYQIGEQLDLTGLELTVTFSDDDTTTIHGNALINDVAGFDSTQPGNKTVTVTYTGHTDTFTVKVVVAFVTFNPNGGEWDSGEMTIELGTYTTIAEPHNVTKDGCALLGWFTDNNTFNNIWNFENIVNTNLNLYAAWVSLEELGFEETESINSIFNVSNTDEWKAARTAIANGGNNKKYIINIIDDFSTMVENASATFGSVTGIKAAIRGPGKTFTLSPDVLMFRGNLLRIAADQTVMLRDITLKGGNSNSSNTEYSLVHVIGALEIRGGTKITGHEPRVASTSGGGGVYVDGGTFTMYDGEISGNIPRLNVGYIEGSGVYVSNGTFTMKGGKIFGNGSDNEISKCVGSGVCVRDGTFTMDGGEISGNTAAFGGGVYMYGATGTFTMNGGKIANNTGGGVEGSNINNTIIITMNDGEISGNTGGRGVAADNFTMYKGKIFDHTASGNGGGVYAGNFTMYGGEIFNNTSNRNGGGVYVYMGDFTMNGGKISGNTVLTAGSDDLSTGRGGGVYFYSNAEGTFTMNDGEISDNTADNDGGGVYVYVGDFIMNGGKISGNTVLNEVNFGRGGGVYCYYQSFTMNNGEIYNNTAKTGGGVYCSDGRFTMNGGEIYGNTAETGGGVWYSGSPHYSPYPTMFYISNGTIYGSGAAANLRNTATATPTATAGSALYIGYGACYGPFDGTWLDQKGVLSTTNNTIQVIDGELQP